MQENLLKLKEWFLKLKTWQKVLVATLFLAFFPWKLITPEDEGDKYIHCVFTHTSKNINATMDSIDKACGEIGKRAFDECMDDNKDTPNSGMFCLQQNADTVNSALKRNQIVP